MSGWGGVGGLFWLVGLRSYFLTRRMPYRKTIRDESSSKNFCRHNVFAKKNQKKKSRKLGLALTNNLAASSQ